MLAKMSRVTTKHVERECITWKLMERKKWKEKKVQKEVTREIKKNKRVRQRAQNEWQKYQIMLIVKCKCMECSH